MKQRFCSECGSSHIPGFDAIIISYIASAIALLLPFVKATSSGYASEISVAGFDIPVFAAIVLGVWFLSGFINGRERHSTHALCAINSLGLPGLLILITTAGENLIGS